MKKMSNPEHKKFKLVKVILKNFRSFGNEQTISIGDLTILVGKNDVGKSNVLKAIKKVFDDEKIEERDLHKYKGKIQDEGFIEVELEINGKREKFRKFFKKDKNNKIKEVLQKYDNKKNEYINFTTNDKKELKSKFPGIIYIPAIKKIEDEVSFKTNSLISRLLLPIIEETSSEKEKTENVKILIKNLENLINKKSKNIIENLTSEMKKLWDDIEDVKIETEFSIKKAISSFVKIKDMSGEYFDITDKGSGVQRYFIVSLLELYRKMNIGNGYLILFEEPEIFLHWGAQKKLSQILKDFSEEGQVIITTHSPIFVNKGESNYIFITKKEKGKTIIKNFKKADLFNELGIYLSDIYLTDGIIFVEGPSDVEILRILFDKLWGEYNISILTMGGSGNVKHLLERIPEIKKINSNIAIILDGDKQSELQSKVKKLKEEGIKCYFWNINGKIVKDIENLFSKQAIEKVFNIEIKNDFKEDTDIENLINTLMKTKSKNQKWEYNKVKHGRKIIDKMIEIDDKNLDYFKNLIENILKEFALIK